MKRSAPVTDGPAPAHGAREIDLATVALLGACVFVVSELLHEGGHTLATWAVGGHPALLSTTAALGDWSRVRTPGMLAIGLGGSLANVALALAGWRVFRRRRATGGALALVAWLFFAVNAWIVGLYAVASPAFGFGDWMMVLDLFRKTGLLRVSVAITGALVSARLWSVTTLSLAQLVGNGAPARRVAKAKRIAFASWVSGSVAVVAAAMFSRLGPGVAVPIALGSTAGASWPILLAAYRVADFPVPGAALGVERSPRLIGIALIIVGALVGVFGRGLSF
jgi:hypothetical protein